MRTNLDTSSRGLSFSYSRSSSLHSPFPSKASFLHQQKKLIYVSIYISLLQSYTNIVLCTNFISEQAEILPQEQLGSFTGTTKNLHSVQNSNASIFLSKKPLHLFTLITTTNEKQSFNHKSNNQKRKLQVFSYYGLRRQRVSESTNSSCGRRDRRIGVCDCGEKQRV